MNEYIENKCQRGPRGKYSLTYSVKKFWSTCNIRNNIRFINNH